MGKYQGIWVPGAPARDGSGESQARSPFPDYQPSREQRQRARQYGISLGMAIEVHEELWANGDLAILIEAPGAIHSRVAALVGPGESRPLAFCFDCKSSDCAGCAWAKAEMVSRFLIKPGAVGRGGAGLRF